MNAKAHHLITGQVGEDLVIKTLKEKGWKVLSTNWRPPGKEQCLELDIVAKDKGTLVFVEVKTRKRKKHDGIPTLAAFTAKKQQNMLKAAMHYLAHFELWSSPCRFDLFCIDNSPEGHNTVEHFSNVIELGNFVDSQHTSWQPW